MIVLQMTPSFATRMCGAQQSDCNAQFLDSRVTGARAKTAIVSMTCSSASRLCGINAAQAIEAAAG
jgi:hypothetical protein